MLQAEIEPTPLSGPLADSGGGQSKSRSSGLDPEQAQAAGIWLQANAIDQKRQDALEVLDWLRAQQDRVPSPAHAWDFQETTQWMQLLHAVKSE